MKAIHRNATVPYTPAEMFQLVDDIEAYPQFLPWCRGARVLERDEQRVRATLAVATGRMEKSFTTLNVLRPHKQIEMRLVEGPFRRLEGLWRFESMAGGGCRVLLDMTIEMSGRIMALTLGPVFHHAANHLVDAFVNRARQVYGRR
ncbi:MAG: type II toxin-antitoxin system RatA family toxin [Gammaproteobacteria bacterium]